MPTYDQFIPNSQSDAEQQVTSPFTMQALSSSDYEMHDKGDVDGYVGLRFTSVNIPASAIINSAKIQFEVENTGTSTVTCTFRGEYTGNSSEFTTTAGNISDRTETSASVDWAIPTWGTIGERGANQLSPDMSSIVEEIIGHPSWASGNAMTFMIKAWPDNSGTRFATSFDGGASNCAELIIDFSTLTLEQEGFRWRNDNGSEITATWSQNQDIDDTAEKGAVRRLRVLVNATGDPGSEQYKLRYKRTSEPAANFRDVPVE